MSSFHSAGGPLPPVLTVLTFLTVRWSYTPVPLVRWSYTPVPMVHNTIDIIRNYDRIGT